MSKLTITTGRFQEMVTKAAKGASNNKLLPITSLLAIDMRDNVLTLTTTDTTNTLKVIAEKVEGDDLYAVVPVEVFSKLIAKTTSENITLTLKDSSLEVKGNGVYNIALTADEDGVVKFPEYKFAKKGDPATLHLTSVKALLAVNKPSIANSLDTPCLCGYYLGDKVITTNELVICVNDMKLLESPALISQDMMNLLALNTQENINFYRNGNFFLFETPNVVIHGSVLDGIVNYPVKESISFLEREFPSMCKVPKLLIQKVIDRLSLFIEPYDKNGAYFTFSKEGVRITSKKSSSVETISYQESKNFAPFICCVDIPMLKDQIDAIQGEVVELWYGDDAAIKLTSGNVTQVIALIEDPDMGEALGN